MVHWRLIKNVLSPRWNWKSDLKRKVCKQGVWKGIFLRRDWISLTLFDGKLKKLLLEKLKITTDRTFLLTPINEIFNLDQICLHKNLSTFIIFTTIIVLECQSWNCPFPRSDLWEVSRTWCINPIFKSQLFCGHHIITIKVTLFLMSSDLKYVMFSPVLLLWGFCQMYAKIWK